MHKTFYVTTPIYYVNDKPHIGHAYTTLAADVIARFKRLDGYDVKFITGTDEHGQKVEKSARQAGLSPQEFTDKVSVFFQTLNTLMNFSADDFIRTTETRHKEFVQRMWNKLEKNGDIYLGSYKGWYSIRDEAFYPEKELVDGKAPTGNPVEWVEEESYFFRLSKWQESLLKFYDDNPDFIAPLARKNEVIQFVKSGLYDLSISRTSFKWGIAVPNNPQHIIYVWLDALCNYLSVLGEETQYWPCDLHIVGKDILRFHAVYWPAFLMSAGYPCPKKLFAHGWWTNEGQKISKSLGNVIDPIHLIEKYGVDYVRFYLMREIPFGNDGNYAHDAFIARINAELVNNIGNLVQRTVSFAYKNCNGVVPTAVLNSEDKKLIDIAYETIKSLRQHIEAQAIQEFIAEIVKLAQEANIYIDHQAPWNLKKTDEQRMNAVIYTLLEVIKVLAIYLQPLIPDSALKILELFGIKKIGFEKITNSLEFGSTLQKPEIIFSRLEVK